MAGNFSITNFDGFTYNGVSDSSIGTPTFRTTETYLWEEFKNDGQLKGLLVPGGQLEAQFDPQKPKSLQDSPLVKKRLILFLSARLVK